MSHSPGPLSEAELAPGLVPSAEQPANPVFSYLAKYSSGGTYASALALQDVNGDGKLDVVIGNECVSANVEGCPNGVVAVLLGKGDGTFQAPVSYGSGGEGAYSVAVADVNGDGAADLLVANGNGIDVLFGNGDGTFQTAVNYDPGIGAFFVVVADVNCDGNPDLIVSGNNGANVLLGNGDGTFQAAISGGGGSYEAVADVNGDGKPDLIIADSASVGVSLGNGDGTFQTETTYGSGASAPVSVAVTDVNGDGKPDVIVANECAPEQAQCANGNAGVLLGNGDGTFQAVVSYLSGGQLTLSLAVGDMNQDGRPDIVLYNNSLLTFGTYTAVEDVLLGNGDGTFQAATGYLFGYSLGNDRAGAQFLGLGDLNGDGKPDLVVASQCYDASCVKGAVGVLLNVSKAPSTTMITSSINPSIFGKRITFTARVLSSSGVPTGKVQFLSGSTVLATTKLTSGSAQYSTTKLPAGSTSITAVYEGDSNNSSSTSSPVSQFVQGATNTTLTLSPSPSAYGQAVIFTAAVNTSAGTLPDGETVTFKQGTNVLGIGMLRGGTATFSYSSLGVGTKSITASYGGDGSFASSVSKISNQIVSKASTTTALTSSQDPSALKQSLTLTASITPQYGGTVTGKVTFKDGTKTLINVTVSGGTAKFTIGTLAAGAHDITATYSGPNFISSSASLMQTVD